ncbi:MAG: transglutaminase family protein [Candidatus Thorarchaeota archaeon]
MNIKKISFFLIILIFPITTSAFTRSPITSIKGGNFPFSSSPDYGVSNYNITQNVKYQVEINFTLTHKSIASRQYWLKFSRLNDRQPNSTLTQYSGPYQESELMYSNINIPSYLVRDEFNNTYDLFNTTLNNEGQITLDQLYYIKLNEVDYNDINELDIGTYNFSDEIFDLYCNRSETYYERNNAALINESNNIVDPGDNPIEKAKKIYDWVCNYLTYNDSMPDQEMGALWAYQNKQGDCSEYSTLMITLLRIQNIPARKVTGFCISNNPATRPIIGKEYVFSSTKSGGISSSNFLGHAWVEYYVPEIGWIACDPTWYGSGYEYFNRVDYLRLNFNVGQWFSIPVLPDVSEFPNPCIVYQENLFDYSYQVKLTVLESNLMPLPQFPFLLILFIGVGVAAVLITIILFIRFKRKNSLYEYN